MEHAELADRMLITQLLHTYCARVDRADLDGVLALFTPDAVVELGPDVVARGPAELRALMADRLGRWATTSHHTSTDVLLAYTGRAATVTSHLYVLHDHPGRDEAFHLWGRYDDELVSDAGTWRFRTRRLEVAAARRTRSQPLPDRFAPVTRAPLPAG